MNTDQRSTYVVHFHKGRLSTLRIQTSLVCRAYNAEELTTKVYRFALQHLPNAIMEVEFDPDANIGRIITAWKTIATFEVVKQS